MPTISQLSQTSSLSGSDRIPVYSDGQGDTRSASLLQVAAFVQASLEGPQDQTIYSLTTTGSSFTLAVLPYDQTNSVWAQLTLSMPASSGTIILPGADERGNGQEVLVTCTQVVTTLAILGNGAGVRGAPTSILADGYFKMRYDSISNQWFRIG